MELYKHLVWSSLRRTTFPAPSFIQVPIVLCVMLIEAPRTFWNSHCLGNLKVGGPCGYIVFFLYISCYIFLYFVNGVHFSEFSVSWYLLSVCFCTSGIIYNKLGLFVYIVSSIYRVLDKGNKKERSNAFAWIKLIWFK